MLRMEETFSPAKVYNYSIIWWMCLLNTKSCGKDLSWMRQRIVYNLERPGLQIVTRLCICQCICLSSLGNWGIKLISWYSIQKDTNLYTGTAAQYNQMILKSEGNELKVIQIGPSGCVRCHGNKVSTIKGVIFSYLSLLSLSLLSAGLLFSQKGLS